MTLKYFNLNLTAEKYKKKLYFLGTYQKYFITLTIC